MRFIHLRGRHVVKATSVTETREKGSLTKRGGGGG